MAIWDNSHAGRLTISSPIGALFSVRHKNGSCSVHIQWTKEIAPEISAAMRSSRGMLMQRITRDLDPLVPFDTGMLKRSPLIASDYENGEIIWSTPYARRQYYLHPMGTDLHGDTGLRGSYWCERGTNANKISWEKFWKAAVRKEMKQK